MKVSGGSVSLSVAIGGAVTPNLVVFGNLFGTGAAKPDVSIGGFASGASNASLSLNGIGPGVAYYLVPWNIYGSATLAAMVFRLDDSAGHAVYQSKTGIGFQALVGKEWWVSQNWGIGVAGEVIAASMKDKNDSNVTWSGAAFSLLFSATYN